MADSAEPEEAKLTYVDAMMHLLKLHLGLGVFAMGDAIKKSGYVTGPILTVVVGCFCLYSDHRLLAVAAKLQTELNLSERPGYAATAELCFVNGPPSLQKYSSTMKTLISVLTCISHLGFCCVYLIFVSKSAHNVFAKEGSKRMDIHYQMLIVVLPIYLVCMIRSLKKLAPVAVIGNFLMLFGVLVTMYYLVQDIPPITTRNPLGELEGYPMFFGVAIFAFFGIALVIPLQNSMKNPENFVSPFGVLNVGLLIVSILNVTTGVLSYAKYGEEIQASVTLNLPKEVLAHILNAAVNVSIILSFPLQFFIPISIMYPPLAEKYGPLNHPSLAELSFRSLFVLLIIVLAEGIPYLQYFISLIGATTGTTIALLIPPILDIVTEATYNKVTACLIIRSMCVFGFGILGLATGTYSSIKAIVEAMARGDDP